MYDFEYTREEEEMEEEKPVQIKEDKVVETSLCVCVCLRCRVHQLSFSLFGYGLCEYMSAHYQSLSTLTHTVFYHPDIRFEDVRLSYLLALFFCSTAAISNLSLSDRHVRSNDAGGGGFGDSDYPSEVMTT